MKYHKDQRRENKWWASSVKKFVVFSNLLEAMNPIICLASGSIRPRENSMWRKMKRRVKGGAATQFAFMNWSLSYRYEM